MKHDDERINRIKKVVYSKLNKERVYHTKRVMETAVKLAKKKGISEEKTYMAALLHDYAKNMSPDKLENLALESSWRVDKLEISIPSILHAPAGAYLAEIDFNIKDYAILEAIRFHTLGSPKMGRLAHIIFAADIIEPKRNFPGIKNIRRTIDKNFIAGIISICERGIQYNFEKNNLVHPNTLLLRNSLLEGKSK